MSRFGELNGMIENIARQDREPTHVYVGYRTHAEFRISRDYAMYAGYGSGPETMFGVPVIEVNIPEHLFVGSKRR